MPVKKDVIVNDNGTGYVKCGYAGDNFPRGMFPAMVGRPILRADESGSAELKDIMVGDECHAHRSLLDVQYPLSNGIVRRWEDMEHLWDYTWKYLDCNPPDCKIMLTEAPMNPMKNRRKTFEIMFEKYGFGAAFVSLQAVLVLYAQGILSGTVVDSGDGVTHVIPVYEGHYAPQTGTEPNVRRLDLAGHALTDHLLSLLQRRGYTFNRSADFATVQQIKEKFAYCAVNFDLEKKLAFETTTLEKSYLLPDGRNLKIGMERFECAEPLFRPDLAGVETRHGGISQMAFDCINSSSRDVQSELFKHVVLSGGTTMLPGLPTRMYNDMKELYVKVKQRGKAGGPVKVRIEDAPRRKHMVFLGASVLADAMTDEQWVSKADWEEDGQANVMSKCPDVREI